MRSKPASPRTLCDRRHQSSSKRSVGPSIVTVIAPSRAFNRVCASTAGPTWKISPSLETTVTVAAAHACDGPPGALSRPSVRQRKHIALECWRRARSQSLEDYASTASAPVRAAVARARPISLRSHQRTKMLKLLLSSKATIRSRAHERPRALAVQSPGREEADPVKRCPGKGPRRRRRDVDATAFLAFLTREHLL